MAKKTQEKPQAKKSVAPGVAGRLNAAALFVIGAVLFLSVNIIADGLFSGARLDFTEDGLYTLSDGSRTIVSELKEPVSIRFYFSEKTAAPYPGLYRYGKRARDMLIEFERASGGNIELTLIEPEPFSEEEDEAVAYGLQAVPTSSGDNVYLGMVVSDTTDQQTVIPFFAQQREAFLEYDIAKTIYALSEPAKPKLALLTSLPMQYGPGGIMAFVQGQGRPYVIYQQLQEFFEVETLEADFSAIPDDAAAIMIVHPPALSKAQLYTIDQFVLGGGRALVFVDPYAEEALITARQGMQAGAYAPPPAPESSDLAPLLAAWGVDYAPDMVVADLENAQKVDMGTGGPRSVRDYIVWLGLGETSLNQNDIVSGAVGFLNLADAGALKAREGATTEFTPLVTSGQVSTLLPAESVKGRPDPDQLIRDMVPDDEVYTLVARVTGPVASAFPDGPPDGVAGEDAEGGTGPHMAQSTGDINIIVGADTDMFADRFWVRVQNFFGQTIASPIADNGAFIVNAADHLAGTEALVSLRGRGVSQRPFEAVERIRRAAEARFLDEEQRLQAELEATQKRLDELEGEGGAAGLPGPEQEAEIQRFREQLLVTRQQLRVVQRNMRRDIDNLETLLAAINIAAVPTLLLIAGLGLPYLRRRRERRDAA